MELNFIQIISLFFAAMIAGGLNSVAGGGSFISFPALHDIALVPSINANATNTIALWPGSVASIGAYRRELAAQRRILIVFSLISFIGGYLGSALLLRTPETTFDRMIPFLLLFATLLFTFSPSITKWVRTRAEKKKSGAGNVAPVEEVTVKPWSELAGPMLLHFAVSIYGGFFGAGIGIMMLAVLGLMGMENIHNMNALKTLLASIINGIAAANFVLSGAIWWPHAILMITGAIIGGYAGAAYARRLDPKLVRRFVIVVAFTITFLYFINL
jgi:uncharacterized protein